VTPEVSDYELSRVYFIVSSKYDEAALTIEHHPHGQVLMLPVYPSSAVDEALPLLDTATAHYASQWEKIMVDDLDRDAKGFSVPGDHLPNGIAPMDRAPELLTIARRHVDHPDAPEGKAWLEADDAKVLWGDAWILPSNKWEFVHEVEVFNEHGIDILGDLA
jgi:hypothetical protein